MSAPLRLGIAGLGTVGVGVVRIVKTHAELLAARCGRPVEITAVSARDRSKDRGVGLTGYAWCDDPVDLAVREDIDVFVEVMGGSEGPAKQATEAALAAGKDVVTANKALLAMHGQALAEKAEAAGRVIRFEAAVAGGIPVIKALTEGLAANQVTRVMGVMNGTCNYILTRMEKAGLTYEEAFAEADGLGYVEADPTLDIGGIDAGHKLALLAAIAFGTQPNFDGITLDGIDKVSIDDIRQAADMGFCIKLLGVAQRTARGLEQRMTQALDDGAFSVISATIVLADRRAELESKLADLLAMSDDDIDAAYEDQLMNQITGSEKGAGLGLFEIRRQSSQLSFDFIPDGENFMLVMRADV